MSRLKELRAYVDKKLNKIDDEDKRISATAHLYGVSLAAQILAKKRGLDPEEAKRRIAMQMSDDEYCELGDYSIDNSWDLEALNEKVDKLISEQLHARGIRI